MYHVAVLGHSLVPRGFDVIPGIDIEVYRKPGGLWIDLEAPEFREFWEKEFDLAILVLGGNDLARESVATVLDRAKEFITKAKDQARVVRVYTIEQKFYQDNNRFGIDPQEFKSKV